MKIKSISKMFTAIMVCCMMLPCFLFAGCDWGKDDQSAKTDDTSNNTQEEYWDDNTVTDIEVNNTEHNFVYTQKEDEPGTYVATCSDEGCDKETTFTITYDSGTADCYSVTNNTITFSGIAKKSVYSIAGEFYGNIVIDVSDDYKFELSLQGFSVTSFDSCPITILSGDKVTISAVDGTKNYIYDLRDAVSDDDEDSYKGAIHAECDLDIQGKGELYIKSSNNNGIHTKDDLNIKNLTLQVDCQDNALKGNDSVTIESGTLTLIARAGDGIKTSNSDGPNKQKGTIAITGGTILVYSACDGIDAAYNVDISEAEESSVDLKIYTDKYSKYSSEVTDVSDELYYVRFTNTNYKYSLKFYNNDNGYVWANSSTYITTFNGRQNYYYYPITKPSGYNKVQVYIYDSTQTQGQDSDYTANTEISTINSSYDTIAFENRGGRLSYSWTNYTTSSAQPGGGQQDGNTDKGDYSTKGIKADNEIIISAGTIEIQSYDDAIHANKNDELLENNEAPLGNITISGGTLTLYSNDDGIHADNALSISNGTIAVTNCYEGLEGNTVTISGGNVSIVSKDDGINGTATSGTCISVTGGTLYVYAGGDGLDSNSTTRYSGISFNGGKSVIIATSADNSSIDTENGYSYTSGYVVAIGRSGGMNSSESTNCSNFSSIGKSTTINVSKDNYVVASNVATIKMPVTQSSLIVVLGSTSTSINSSSTTSATLDNNGVYWAVS